MVDGICVFHDWPSTLMSKAQRRAEIFELFKAKRTYMATNWYVFTLNGSFFIQFTWVDCNMALWLAAFVVARIGEVEDEELREKAKAKAREIFHLVINFLALNNCLYKRLRGAQ